MSEVSENDAGEGQLEDPMFDEDASLDEEGLEASSDSDEHVSVQLPVGASEESLERLIGLVMRQDEAALATLYHRLNGPVYSLAFRITRNQATAEEVLQDVFWQVWLQAPRFDASRGSAIAWVLTMARSRALDAARRLSRPAQMQSASSDEFNELLVSPDAGPQDLLFAAQQGSRLQLAMQNLEPLRRQLVSLSFYLGQTQQEIADHTGLPLGTVKSHLRRALLTLREALGDGLRPIQS